MKKVVVFAVILLGWGNMCAQQLQENTGFQIQGKVTGEYHGKVWLVSEEGIGGKHTALDSCEVIGGRYTFKGGNVDVVTMHYIKSKTGKVTPFFLENGSIYIESKGEDFYNAKIGGTLNNEILHFYNLQLRFLRDSTLSAFSIDRLREGVKDKATEAAKFKQRNLIRRQRGLAIEKALVLRYNDQPFAPLMLMFDLAYNVPLEELRQLRKQLSPQLNEHPYVLALDEYIKLQNFRVGSQAYDFCLPGIDGQDIRLKDYRGKYVLLDFWASWCGPCRREMPNVVELYKKYKKKNFEIIGISLDQDREAWKKAVKEMNMLWPQGSELKGWSGEIAYKYNIHAIPSTVLLNPEGKVEALNLRGEKLEAKVEEVLKTK